MHFIIELGGDNHAASYENGQTISFTAGSPSNAGQTYAAGAVLTWDVKIVISGAHYNPGGIGHNTATRGLAAVAFDLELRDANGLVAIGAGTPSTTGFFSSINDGDADGSHGLDPRYNAAFCFGSIDRNRDGIPNGSLISTAAGDGAECNEFFYPGAAGFPPESTTVLGRLSGMGAASIHWQSGQIILGIGISQSETLVGCSETGCGSTPLFEGQVNTTGLPAGSYRLRVVPRSANLIRGDINCTGDLTLPFAIPANQLNGDEIAFVLQP